MENPSSFARTRCNAGPSYSKSTGLSARELKHAHNLNAQAARRTGKGHQRICIGEVALEEDEDANSLLNEALKAIGNIDGAKRSRRRAENNSVARYCAKHLDTRRPGGSSAEGVAVGGSKRGGETEAQRVEENREAQRFCQYATHSAANNVDCAGGSQEAAYAGQVLQVPDGFCEGSHA